MDHLACNELNLITVDKAIVRSHHVSNIVNKIVSLYLAYMVPTDEPSFTLMACFLPELARMSMFFIFEWACSVSGDSHLRNKPR